MANKLAIPGVPELTGKEAGLLEFSSKRGLSNGLAIVTGQRPVAFYPFRKLEYPLTGHPYFPATLKYLTAISILLPQPSISLPNLIQINLFFTGLLFSQ